MPRIFDNIEQSLLPALRDTLNLSDRADFCVGYFNLRGWKQIDTFVDRWSGGPGACCRLLVGMQRLPQEELRAALSLAKGDGAVDNQTAVRLKKKLAEEFREQLTIGVPTNEDEAGLPAAWKAAIAAGRMLVTSPFSKKHRRATAASAEERNRYVVSLADQVIVAHASPGGSLERLCREVLVVQASCLHGKDRGRLEARTTTSKPLWTLDDPANMPLVALGARFLPAADVPARLGLRRTRS